MLSAELPYVKTKRNRNRNWVTHAELEIIRMRDVDGMTFPQIAAHFGVRRQFIRYRYQRGKLCLKRQTEQCGE